MAVAELMIIIGLAVLALILAVKTALMKKAVREIRLGVQERLDGDTNTVIDLSSRDPELRRLAQDLNVQLKELRSQRLRCQQGDQQLKDAVTNISHDLRTPLTAICGYLQLAEEEPKSPELNRILAVIQERTDVLRQLTEQFFRYSILVSAPSPDRFQRVDLRAPLEKCLGAYYSAFKERGIIPVVRMPAEPVWRQLDSEALTRILDNILSNIVKYGNSPLRAELTSDGELRFANPAPRLNPVMAGRLFDRYYTVETGRRSTGLGLSIAKTLTEQMGGWITAELNRGILTVTAVFPEPSDQQNATCVRSL